MPRLTFPPMQPVTQAALPGHLAQFMAPGSNLLPTPPLKLLLTGAHATLSDRRLVVIDGAPGCGKSLALGALSAAMPGLVKTALILPGRTDRAIMAAIHEAVTGFVVERTQRGYENDLRHELAQAPLVLAIDEAENANSRCLRALRHLMEMPGAKFSLVFCGTGIWRLLESEPMLASWTGLRVTFPRLARDTLAAQLHALHPQMTQLTARELDWADRTYAHGCLRSWVALIEWMTRWATRGDQFTDVLLRRAVEVVTS